MVQVHGVEPDGREEVRLLGAECEDTLPAGTADPGQHHPGDPGLTAPGQYLREIILENGQVDMAMGVDELHDLFIPEDGVVVTYVTPWWGGMSTFSRADKGLNGNRSGPGWCAGRPSRDTPFLVITA